MKPTKRVKRPESFAAGVGHALSLAAKSARKLDKLKLDLVARTPEITTNLSG